MPKIASSLRTWIERVPFTAKIFVAFTVIILIALTVVYFFTHEVIFARFHDLSQEIRLRNARNIARPIERLLSLQGSLSDFNLIAREVAQIDRPLGENLVLAGPDGLILAAADESLIGNSVDRRTFREIAPIRVRGPVPLMLFVSPGFDEPTPLETGFLVGINRTILFAGIFAAAVGLGIAFWLTRQIAAPLQKLAVASAKITQGELEQRVEIRSPDALGQLGDAFNTMSEKLSRSEKLRRDMIADIAHELRTPLTLVQGNLQAILDGVYQPTPEKIASIHDKSLLLSRLIRDLQELSLAEAGELPLDRQRTDFKYLVEQVTETIRPQLEARRIALELDFPEEKIEAHIDSKRISQVLLNLLSNAQRYTPEQGKITISSWLRDGSLFISVQDTGPGIPAQDLQNVFERFWRGDASRTRASGGSGLGLAVAKQWVESHGGRIWAESPPGKGAIFTFCLPPHLEAISENSSG